MERENTMTIILGWSKIRKTPQGPLGMEHNTAEDQCKEGVAHAKFRPGEMRWYVDACEKLNLKSV